MAFLDYHTHRASELQAQIRRLEREIAQLDRAATPASGAQPASTTRSDSCAHCATPIRPKAKVCPHCKLVQPHALHEVATFDRKLRELLG